MAEPYELDADAEQIEVDTLDLAGWIVPKGWYGLIRAASTGIIRRDGMEPEAGKVALRALCAPDPHSRSQDFEGRRLARVDGGYLVLNYFKYRDRDYGAAERMRKLRARRKGVTENVTTVTGNAVTANVTQAESREQRAKDRTTTTARTALWLAPICDVYERHYGAGSFNYGMAGKTLKPLHEAGHSGEEIASRMDRYCGSLDHIKYFSLSKFRQTFGAYADGAVQGRNAGAQMVANIMSGNRD